LQKVFLFKENEGDGEMMTVLNFLKDSKGFSKTSTASTLKLMKNNESKQQGLSSSSGSQSSSSSGGSASSGSSGGDSQESGSSSGSNYQYFEALSSIVCCVDGKFAGKLESSDEIIGYMLAKDESHSEDVSLKDITKGRLNNAQIGIKINHKHTNKKIRFENGIPCLDIIIYVNNSEIEDLINETIIGELSSEEYNEIKNEIEKEISLKVAKCFDKTKAFGADIFHAYDIATKFHYNETNSYYDNFSDFLKDLRLNVQVEVIRLDY